MSVSEDIDFECLSEFVCDCGLCMCVVELLIFGGFVSMVGVGENVFEWFVGGIVVYFIEVKECVFGLMLGIDFIFVECVE